MQLCRAGEEMISLRQLSEFWQRIWFQPTSPASFCLFRIGFGLIAALTAWEWLLNSTDLLTNQAMTSVHTARAIFPYRLSLFWWLFPSEPTVICLLILLLLAAIALTIGYKTRFSAFLVWFLIVSFDNRNPFILNCGDAFIRIAALLVLLGPAGKMYSLDRWFESKKEQSHDPVVLCQPWAQRLMQFQIALVYAWSFFYKSGESWWNGTAVHYAMHVKSFSSFVDPSAFDNIWLCRLLDSGTLIIEFSLFTLVWVSAFRYWVLLAGLLLHSSLLVTMNFPSLQLIMMASYINFIEPEKVQSIVQAVSAKLSRLGKF
jgi:Vitamin K-dependent gamma-carboxylase